MLSGLSNQVIGFGPWRIEPSERRLACDGRAVELNARYFDALLLLSSCPGELITKDRFMAVVWSGVPVTDEALTQCIRSLRRLLNDDAARPRYIETVPRHGYRFIAEARVFPHPSQEGSSSRSGIEPIVWPMSMAAGTLGGAAAGLLGGLAYGLLAANDPPVGTGSASIFLVLTCLCVIVGLLGGAGIAAGIAITQRWIQGQLVATTLGGALGGLFIGALGRSIGLDAFVLLIGSRPFSITGGGEGLVIGTFAGAGCWLGRRRSESLSRILAGSMALGAIAGAMIALCGGRLMAGSLVGIALAYPTAPLGTVLHPSVLPWWATLGSAMVEGATFVSAISLAFAALNRSSENSAAADT